MLILKIRSLIISILFIIVGPVVAQWEAQNPGFPKGYAPLYSYVVDENIVWTVGGHEVDKTPYSGFSKTTDGGKTWLHHRIDIADLDNFRFTSIFALDDSIAWVTMVDDRSTISRGRVLKTLDGGNSWLHQSTAYADEDELANIRNNIWHNCWYYSG